MRIRQGYGGLCYVGADPSTGVGVVRLTLSEMTTEQLKGWLGRDFETASKYIDEQGEKATIPTMVIDNNQGAPLPKIPDNEPKDTAHTTGKKGGYFKKERSK